jgi:hypothetical protein
MLTVPGRIPHVAARCLATSRPSKLEDISPEALDDCSARPFCSWSAGPATGPKQSVHDSGRCTSNPQNCADHLGQIKATIGNKRSHLLGKAKNIMMTSYDLDPTRMDAQEIKSVVTWLVRDFWFMHQDCTVRTVATTPTVANVTLEAGSAILECCDH